MSIDNSAGVVPPQNLQGGNPSDETSAGAVPPQNTPEPAVPENLQNQLKQAMDTITALQKQVGELSKEAAGRRVAKKEAETKALTLEEQVAALMTRLEQSEVAAKTAERQRMAMEVAAELKLHPTLAARLQGETREELLADAQALAQAIPAAPPPLPKTAVGNNATEPGSRLDDYDHFTPGQWAALDPKVLQELLKRG
jgi:FtsZ-binding cell division protein ZapB